MQSPWRRPSLLNAEFARSVSTHCQPEQNQQNDTRMVDKFSYYAFGAAWGLSSAGGVTEVVPIVC